MAGDTEFVDGLIVKAPNPKAPDFVKASISIKREELIDWLSSRSGDWVNIDVKESRNGKWYAAVNDYKPKGDKPNRGGERPAPQRSNDPFPDDDIPF